MIRKQHARHSLNGVSLKSTKVVLASSLNRLPKAEGGVSRLPGPCEDRGGKLPGDTSPCPGVRGGPGPGPLDDIM